MEPMKIVSHERWLEARKALLAKEKEFTRLRDQLSQQRRDLPWERVEKTYVFNGPNGKETLDQLFEGRSQLIIITSCLIRPGRPGARVALSGLTMSATSSCISTTEM